MSVEFFKFIFLGFQEQKGQIFGVAKFWTSQKVFGKGFFDKMLGAGLVSFVFLF